MNEYDSLGWEPGNDREKDGGGRESLTCSLHSCLGYECVNECPQKSLCVPGHSRNTHQSRGIAVAIWNSPEGCRVVLPLWVQLLQFFS